MLLVQETWEGASIETINEFEAIETNCAQVISNVASTESSCYLQATLPGNTESKKNSTFEFKPV